MLLTPKTGYFIQSTKYVLTSGTIRHSISDNGIICAHRIFIYSSKKTRRMNLK